MSGFLQGRVAIVTGSSGGLGSTLCAVLGEHGARVVGVDVVGDDCLLADAATSEGSEAMVREALRRYGQLDILALNAGAQFMSPIPDFPEEQWDRLMDLMAKGPFLTMKYAWRHIAHPGGRVIVTASDSSMIAEKYKSAYVAAKHAVLGLVRTAALEAAPHGMTVNAVGPAWMRTPLVDKQLVDQMRLHAEPQEKVIERMLERMPVKRFVETREVADVIAFLASDAASAINGVLIPIDLGLLAG